MTKGNSLHNFIFFLIMALLIIGCGKTEGNQIVVLNMGFNKNEVFKLENQVCTLPEVMVYLNTAQNKYESVYGEGIWNVEANGISMKANVKDNALADISQIKAMNILAESQGVALSNEEAELAKAAATDYFASLSSHERDFLGVDEDILTQMYSEYALAHKINAEIIKDINPEISDDEARNITVLHILLKTYTTDGTGQMVEYSQKDIDELNQKAQQIHELALDGEHDFADLVFEYSEADPSELSFGHGEMDPIFEETAFDLGKDEISEVIRTQYGFHIIKCISTFNREQTEINKLRIAEEQKELAFDEKYDEFAKGLKVFLNEKLWDSVEVVYDEQTVSSDFFDIYNKHFQ